LPEVIAALDAAVFKECFLAWVETLRARAPDMIAIDGKTSRRSHARSKGRLPLYTVSAWATRQRLVLGQEAVVEKSNEITAIPLLLQRLELTGSLVTIDAMGTQTEIAQTIIDRGGDYLLSLKQNRPATYAEVATFFANPPQDAALQRSETVDGAHDRIETRQHTVCHDVDWLFSDRRYPGEPVFPGLAMLGMISSKTERGGNETRYYLGSAKLDADTFARAVRGHWGIENRLHWVLDVVFHDDLARCRPFRSEVGHPRGGWRCPTAGQVSGLSPRQGEGETDAGRESVDATRARDPATEVRVRQLRPGHCGGGQRGARHGAAVPEPVRHGGAELAAAGDADRARS
jgi:predicted transposase YbfD/YdcC